MTQALTPGDFGGQRPAAAPTFVDRRPGHLVLASLCFLWLAATAWARPLALPDEGRYVGVAWEMMNSGDWLTPTLNGLPFFHKPPLFYWITAASMSLFGQNEWAARAAPMLGAWLGVFSLYLFMRRWCGERPATLTLVVLLVQPLVYIGGQFANLDMLVAGCITATTLLLAHAALCAERGLPFRRALAGAYAMAALGVLAKGLIGVVTPALVIVPWLLMLRRWRTLRSLLWWPGMLLFLLIAAPWFMMMQARFADFLNYFFVVQHFKRFAGSGFNNVQPVWYYPAVLALFSLPWLPWLIRSIRRDGFLEGERGSVRLLMGLWVLMTLLFFSLPKSKLLGYILPAVPPLAFLIVDGYLARGEPTPFAKRLWWGSAALMALTSAVAVLVFTLHPPRSTRELAGVLRTQRAAQEPVFMLNAYLYDLRFYAGVRAPVAVVDEWASPEVQANDNWRKELADAGRFAPARAAKLLRTPAELPAALCSSSVSWVIGTSADLATHPFLTQAEVAYAGPRTMLWKLDLARPTLSASLGCAGPASSP